MKAPLDATQAGCVMLGGSEPLAPALHGLKAVWLDRALRAGECVPPGFVIDAQLAEQLARGELAAGRALGRMLEALSAEPGDACGSEGAAELPLRLAVRASPAISLPGALTTLLDVPCELPRVLAALAEVVASAHAPAVREQLAARGLQPPSAPWLAVIVQRYLTPRAAGDFGAVACTRDPRSAQRGAWGEYSCAGAAQVVSGRTRPEPLTGQAPRALANSDAAAYAELAALAERLEARFQEPLELELLRVEGRLWLLQARPLALAPRALVRLALEAIDDDSPSYARWLEQLAERGLDALLDRHFGAPPAEAVLRGLAASPGAACGVLVTDVARALARSEREPVVLMRPDAVPEDVSAFRAAQAVVTSSGGLTCHAAVIARGLGIPAVVGCADARIDTARGNVQHARRAGAPLLSEGDWVSVDARAGLVYRGRLPVETRIGDPELQRLFAEVRKLRPAPLWVAGELEQVLRLKQEACLDGALCTLPPGSGASAVPAGRGRECWLVLDAGEVEPLLPALPPGWGVVVQGDLSRLSITALRRAAPLRALGVRLERADAFLPQGRLDLLVLGPTPEPGAALAALAAHADAARVLCEVSFSQAVGGTSTADVAGAGALPVRDNVGWLYSASQAAAGALRAAAVRLRGSGRAA